jgi:prolyl-tRNA synthetase
LGWRVLDKINAIIRKHMNAKGAEELFLSALQPIEIWQKTGRDKDLEEVMITFQDRKGRRLCLGPTHEEEITEIARRYLVSYRHLPRIIYQIQTKFRDEPRPRFGLMRSCEFIMKDAYSFDKDKEGLSRSYEKMHQAYQDIFSECGLDFIQVEADPGAMGGSVSHEFMVPAQIGEDILDYCPACSRYYRSQEGSLRTPGAKTHCPACKGVLEEKKMVEIGHIFQLGTKYSLAQDGLFLDEKGGRKPYIMGCYGIGVSRILSAIAEVSSDEKGLIWPQTVCPYDVSLVVLDQKLLDTALRLKDRLHKEGISVLIDDRDETAGVKFNDAYLIGNPYIVILGKEYSKQTTIDTEIRMTRKKQSFKEEELINFLRKEYAR